MTELLFTQLKKAKSPWWILVLAFAVSVIVALLQAKAKALKSQKSVVEYQKQKDVTAVAVAKEAVVQEKLYTRIKEADLKILRIEDSIKEIDAHAIEAKKRIAAAKSLRDLQS